MRSSYAFITARYQQPLLILAHSNYMKYLVYLLTAVIALAAWPTEAAHGQIKVPSRKDRRPVQRAESTPGQVKDAPVNLNEPGGVARGIADGKLIPTLWKVTRAEGNMAPLYIYTPLAAVPADGYALDATLLQVIDATDQLYFPFDPHMKEEQAEPYYDVLKERATARQLLDPKAYQSMRASLAKLPNGGLLLPALDTEPADRLLQRIPESYLAGEVLSPEVTIRAYYADRGKAVRSLVNADIAASYFETYEAEYVRQQLMDATKGADRAINDYKQKLAYYKRGVLPAPNFREAATAIKSINYTQPRYRMLAEELPKAVGEAATLLLLPPQDMQGKSGFKTYLERTGYTVEPVSK